MELDMVHQMIVPTKLGITVLKAALEILSFNMRQTVAIQLARRTKLLATTDTFCTSRTCCNFHSGTCKSYPFVYVSRKHATAKLSAWERPQCSSHT